MRTAGNTMRASQITQHLQAHGIPFNTEFVPYQPGAGVGYTRVYAKDRYMLNGRLSFVWKDVTSMTPQQLDQWLGY